MNLLLDTHALIWFSESAPQLSAKALKEIESQNNISFISMATFWELAIKLSIGKLQLAKPLSVIMAEVQSNGFLLLPIAPSHILQVETLPFLHRDPFDRILIAQALSEGFTLISNETLFDEYGVKRLW